MELTKSKSTPENLNKENNIEISLVECTSFNDFEKLKLFGEQKILTFGEYSQKNSSDKNKRRKVINYAYKNLHSKL
tara:strand:- start:198 stop:425 length:228 start_codon:yes stop_codon:yes gene_type:complete